MEPDIVSKVLEHKARNKASSNALLWAVINFCIVFCIAYDIKYGILRSKIPHYPITWYIERAMAAFFAFNGLFDVGVYLSPIVFGQSIQLTPKQRALLAIKESDRGFSKVTQTPVTPREPAKLSPEYIQSLCSSTLNSSSSYNSEMVNCSSGSWRTSPLNRSSPLSTTSSSWHYMDGSSSQRSSSLRWRNLSPANDVICDEEELANYLMNDSDSKQNNSMMSGDELSSSSFLDIRRTLSNYSPLFTKYPYQICQRTVASPSRTEDLDSPTSFSGDDLSLKFGLKSGELSRWTEHLRQWLSQTVLARLVCEIDSLNAQLARTGSQDVQIGTVSLTTLRQVVSTKSAQLPTLASVLPYLELTTHQEYLVQRLRELCQGGSLGEFRWNGGPEFKGKPWSEILPTDTAILMHMFCSYMDSRLPPHPSYPDGRTFTNQHLKTPDKRDVFQGDETMCIYQSQIQPPHFKLVIRGEVVDIPQGRNNFFHAVLLFLYHIRNKENGMLGRISLGLSGINILWLLEA